MAGKNSKGEMGRKWKWKLYQDSLNKLTFLSLNLNSNFSFHDVLSIYISGYSNLFQLLGSEKPENIQEIKLSYQFDSEYDHDCVCDDDDGNAVAGKSNEEAEIMTNTIMMVLVL